MYSAFGGKNDNLTATVISTGENGDIRVALHAACYYNAKEMVYFLLEKGADPNIVGQCFVFSRVYQAQSPELETTQHLHHSFVSRQPISFSQPPHS